MTGSRSPSQAEAEWHVQGTVMLSLTRHADCSLMPPLDSMLQPCRTSVCLRLACSFTPPLPSSCSHARPLFPNLHSEPPVSAQLKSCLLQEGFPECLSWHTPFTSLSALRLWLESFLCMPPRRGGTYLHISKSTLHNVRPVTRVQRVFLEEIIIIFIVIMNGWR